jgi:dipeptidyl aminopeptidase/acylaminoacyl peptidase
MNFARNLLGFFLIGITFSFGQDLHAAPAPVAKYGALPLVRDVKLSPDGKFVALIGPVKGRDAFIIWNLETDKPRMVVATDDMEPLWIEWKTNTRLIAAARYFSSHNSINPFSGSRLTTINLDGKPDVNLINSGQFANYVPQFQSDVTSMLPDDENHILVELPAVARGNLPTGSIETGTFASRIKYPEVVKVDIDTAKLETVIGQKGYVIRWIADAEGKVRLREVLNGNIDSYEVKNPNDDSWRTIHPLEINKGHLFHPLAFVDGKPDRLYVSSNHEGGSTGLYEYDVPSDSFVRTIAALPDGAISPIKSHGHLVGYVPTDSDLPVYLDQDFARDSLTINQVLKDTRNEILERSKDGKRVLFKVTKGNEPKSYWILSRDDGKVELRRQFDTYPGIAAQSIAATRIIHYKARDGLDIPALLTLPANFAGDANKPGIPFVILPHGGPTYHDELGFDYIVQFLASRGYGVLQPQFRGSTGFGAKFEAAGLQQWGLAMQDDITDGTRWLLEEKLADPKRIVIVGASYGGYAALMGAVKEPDLYRAAVAIAPVTDLPIFIERTKGFLFGDLNVPRIGSDQDQLIKTSPDRNADRIRMPILMVHGRRDYTVPVIQTELMEKALKNAGNPAQVLYLDEADHFLSRASDRTATLNAMEIFLSANLKQ